MTLPPLPPSSDAAAPAPASDAFPRVFQAEKPSITLPPDVRRDVEEIARRYPQEMQRGLRGPVQGNTDQVPGGGREFLRPSPFLRGEPGGTLTGPPLGGLGGEPAPSESRIELPRVPSPTEPHAIRSIPVPEEFVPLGARSWPPSRKAWAAAATCHTPLYFQDAPLERYGMGVDQALGPLGRYTSFPLDDPTKSNQRQQFIQPFWSIAKFGTQIALWPWNMVMNPPWEAEYDLGYWRPGDRVPPDLLYWPLTGYGPPLRGSNY